MIDRLEKMLADGRDDPMLRFGLGSAYFNKDEWAKRELDDMLEINRLKFEQNEDLCKSLMDTGENRLGEAAHNKVWGTGLPLRDKDTIDTTKWTGQNKMGIVLETIRSDYSSD